MPTIFSTITSPIRSGVSVIRISGPNTFDCLKTLGFNKTPQHQKVSFCKISDPKTSEIIDETLISCFKSPNSFTGEDVAEISIHASPFITKKIFEILSSIDDVRLAEAGEFSKRAFLNGKLDLVQAEAIPDLIAAETEAQHKQALKQLQGKLGDIYEDWRYRLIEISALIEAAIDFPDEDLPQNIIDEVESKVHILSTEIASHLNDQKIGHKIKDGLNLAIIGAPNVGKSSLINFLAKSDVAIVSDIAGTTRDVVETHLSIAGIPLKISDTAGIRKTDNKIEQEGINRALKKAKEADIKILLLDASSLDEDELSLADENTIIVANKIDLLDHNITKETHDLIQISLSETINLDHLLEKIEEKILSIIPNQNSPLITQERYRASLEVAVENLEEFSLDKDIELAAEDLRLTAREIGKITGKVDIENILDVIFSRFCIGK